MDHLNPPPLPRIAMVGATRGAILMRSLWQSKGLAQPAAICDLNEPLARQQAAMFPKDGPEVLVFTDLESLLDWGEFDAALIATSDATHHQLASKVLDRGFHCFIEKPMTTTVADAGDLVHRWQRSGKVAAVGHEFRHTRAIQAAKTKIQEGVIGTPRLAITMDSCGRMGSYWRRKRWRKSQTPAGNSLTLQKAIHHLDIQMYLMGSRAASVYASGGQDHFGGERPSDLTCDHCDVADQCMYEAQKIRINGMPNNGMAADRLCVYTDDVQLHDNQVVVIDYASGSRGSYVECFFTPEYKIQHTIIGDLGQLDIRVLHGDPYQRISLSWIGRDSREELVLPSTGGHGGGDDRLAEVFCAGIREGRAVTPDPIDGFHAVALACAIDESSRARRPAIVADLPQSLQPSLGVKCGTHMSTLPDIRGA